MDRAHRIGQKRVVSVYRLITRHTLEEKIMSLQRFKLHTARTVISADNASLHTMATDQVINHFFSRSVCRFIPVFSRSCQCFLPQEVKNLKVDQAKLKIHTRDFSPFFVTYWFSSHIKSIQSRNFRPVFLSKLCFSLFVVRL
jgi:hypothetical protein